MKIIEKNFRKGFVKVAPESQDDLWHLYNIIYKGDEVYAYSSRAIKSDTEYSRPKGSERVSTFIGVTVESVSWDKFLGKLRVHGLICHAPEIIPVGVYHTLNIALNQPVTIVKKEWPQHIIDRLTRAIEAEMPLLIIAIDDEGFAIAKTRQYGVDIKVEERVKLPGKLEADKRSLFLRDYFSHALKTLRELWDLQRCPIVIVGVGFIKNDFAEYITSNAGDLAKAVLDVKSVNNSGVSGIYESLRSGVLLKAAAKLRILTETQVMEEVLKRLGKDESMVTYGFANVEYAAQMGAIEKLVIADVLLRDSEELQRLRLEALMQLVEQRRGNIIIVSTEHEAGEKVLALSGIAALLRFPVSRNP